MASKLLILHNFKRFFAANVPVKYVQGQSPEPNIREYFYYIDHQGMLFLDDTRIKNFTSCFKDPKFLAFFFNRLRFNTTGRYTEIFPFLSLCGRERNFIRCDDLPIVFTNISDDKLFYGHAGQSLFVSFDPERLTMEPETGRVYHPALKEHAGAGLIRSALAVQLSRDFIFESGENEAPTHFRYKNNVYKLLNWFKHPLR